MFLNRIAALLIRRAEARIGVKLEYVHEIARTDIGLLNRYNKIFSFLDPNKKTPALAYHIARLRGAIASDCGTCVEIEITLAHQAKIGSNTIENVLCGDYSALPVEIKAVAQLADAVVARREDDASAREQIIQAFGKRGLIELAYAMNGAAMLPSVKRAMGYATTCDLSVLRKVNAQQS